VGRRKIVDFETVQSLVEDQTYLSHHLVSRPDIALETLALGGRLIELLGRGLDAAGGSMTQEGLAGLPEDTVGFWLGSVDAPSRDAALFRAYVLRNICEAIAEDSAIGDEVRNLLGGYTAVVGDELTRRNGASDVPEVERIGVEHVASALVNDLMSW